MTFSVLPSRSDDTSTTPTTSTTASERTAPPSPGGATVRELLVELARLEDAMRVVPTFGGRDDPATGAGLQPDLAVLAAREREILAALRAVSGRGQG